MDRIVTLTMNPSIDLSTSIDHLAAFEKLRCAPETRHPGGGGINVARVVARLGGDVQAIYPAGGVTGALLHQLVTMEGVAGLPIAVASETRQDFTVFDREDGKQYRFVLPGLPLAPDEWQACAEALQRSEPRPDYLVVSGTLPPGLPDDFLVQNILRAKARGCRIVIDTSGAALRQALDVGIAIVKPNLGELVALSGAALPDQASRIALCRSLVAAGKAEIIALTLGAHGAVLVTANKTYMAPALDVPVATTVGAGDSFLAGLVQGLAAGQTLKDAFKLAVAAGSAALLHQGTGLARLEDIMRLLSRVQVEDLE